MNEGFSNNFARSISRGKPIKNRLQCIRVTTYPLQKTLLLMFFVILQTLFKDTRTTWRLHSSLWWQKPLPQTSDHSETGLACKISSLKAASFILSVMSHRSSAKVWIRREMKSCVDRGLVQLIWTKLSEFADFRPKIADKLYPHTIHVWLKPLVVFLT